MIDHLGDANKKTGAATPEECSAVHMKGDAMSEQAHDTTETESDATVSDQQGVLMRISRNGLWVNPDIPADECAQHMLASLSPLLSHTINTEVNIQVARLAAKRDAAQAEVRRLKAEVRRLKATNEREVAQLKRLVCVQSSEMLRLDDGWGPCLVTREDRRAIDAIVEEERGIALARSAMAAAVEKKGGRDE